MIGDELMIELQTWCKSRLRHYEYPHVIEFVDELPKTQTGKIQRFKLRNLEPCTVTEAVAARADR